ncbi:hypothetical protein Tco_1339024 [Tanacetum coccineum]
MKDGIMKRQVETSTTNDEVSSIAINKEETPPCQLPKELSPGSFLLPFNINNHNLYAIATLDSKDNLMPLRVYEYLEFSCNFVIKKAEDVIILGRPFLESTRAQIDVFNEEISFEIGSKKFKFNIDSCQSMEKIYMVDISQEEETFNPIKIGIDLFSYESLACLEFEQRTRVFNNEIEHLSNEYILRIGKKGYVLDDVWEKCQQNYKKSNEAWHGEAHEEDEM